jgi:hypothetical protein
MVSEAGAGRPAERVECQDSEAGLVTAKGCLRISSRSPVSILNVSAGYVLLQLRGAPGRRRSACKTQLF